MGATAAQDKSVALAIADRRQRVAANLLGGLTYSQMAEALGVSKATIVTDVAAILEEYREYRISKVDRMKLLEDERLNRALNAIWNDMIKGEPRAVELFLKISERRSKMWGFDVPSTTRHLHNFGKMTKDELIEFLVSLFSGAGEPGDGGDRGEGAGYPALDDPNTIDGQATELA